MIKKGHLCQGCGNIVKSIDNICFNTNVGLRVQTLCPKCFNVMKRVSKNFKWLNIKKLGKFES